jgi:DNA polymerase-3 subunit delta'
MHWNTLGHHIQKEYLARLCESGTLAHAYLLAGPGGLGKRSVAEDIAAFLVPSTTALDVMRCAPVTDGETGKIAEIPIEAIKQLKAWVALTPTGAHKVILIDDADRLGPEAANTLLKVLEEPPAYAHFFLITSRPGQVMSTIASRCERLDFSPIPQDEMQRILAPYPIDVDDKALLAVVAGGRPGYARSLIESGKVPMVARAIADFEKLLRSGVAERLIASKSLAERTDVVDVVGWWTSYVYDRLSERPVLAGVAHGLMELSQVLAASHYNRRLAVEAFLLHESSFFGKNGVE